MSREHKKIERYMLFSEVAKQLSFTQAAETLGISRGYLSDQIKHLEKEIGTPLLIRSTRNVMLTSEGQRFLEGMENIRSSLLELERSVQHERRALEGTLRITAPNLFSQRYLQDICHAFRKQHPGIRFSIDSSYTNYDLMQSNFDLAFRATNTPPQNMVAKALLSYQHPCCASPEYLTTFGTPRTPKDLAQHHCLSRPSQHTWRFKSGEVPIKGWIELNDNYALKQLALQGRGIIRLPEYFIDREVESGKLVKVLEREKIRGQKIFIIHPQQIRQSARLRAFIDFTQAWFAKHNNRGKNA
ncbi:LysR family transcriptional regulator [Pseudomaricurvus alkylphenolicus]|uniref:LysR family transcriptional regulator n=1 Tax=Pseudomaricurvus alkylphenolicus TaxID=1306991 RepID=UPI001981A27D|nr:LysR family transcriptional regulator [Pseudomaricurvus alkylphenolicus]